MGKRRRSSSRRPPVAEITAQRGSASSNERGDFAVAPAARNGEEWFPSENGLVAVANFQSALTPYSLSPRKWRAEISAHGGGIFLALLLYGYTAPRLVALEDDGLFISNLHFFRRCASAGLSLHTLLGSIFYHLLPLVRRRLRGHFLADLRRRRRVRRFTRLSRC